jgi:hypothetical protein
MTASSPKERFIVPAGGVPKRPVGLAIQNQSLQELQTARSSYKTPTNKYQKPSNA